MPADGLGAWTGAAERALALAQRAGLEAEVRAERFLERGLVLTDGAISAATSVEGAGLGVRVMRGARSGYASTTQRTPAELRRCVEQAARMAGAAPRARVAAAPRRAAAADAGGADDDPDLEAKLDLLRRGTQAARDAGKDLAAVVAGYHERLGERLVLRTDGARASWEPRAVALEVSAASRAGHGLAKGREFHGGSLALGAFRGEQSPEAIGERAARWAAERRDARRPPAGRHRVLVDGFLAGVLAHESLGHLAEGDLVAGGWSKLRGREGERLASRWVTVRDAGLPPPGAGGLALPFDDEGTPSREATILQRGVLRGFLHTRATARGASTGNARALDYRFPPICRMRNTWVEPGDRRLEELLEEVGEGVYLCGSSGGEARSDGSFLFTALRAYRVAGGEVAEPLREVSILGDILRFLRGVEAAGRDLRIVAGANVNCGKWGQWPLPVAYGGPHLLVRDALLGGEGVSWGAAR